MGTELEELDPETDPEEEVDPNASKDTKVINDLRKQLRARDKELKNLRPLKETNAFLEAGLGSLSEDHKTALRAVVGEDFSQDNVLAKAKILGFQATPAGNVEETKHQEQIQGEVNTINATEESINKPTAKPDTRDLNAKIRAAKSQEEVMALIAAEGEAAGLLIEDE